MADISEAFMPFSTIRCALVLCLTGSTLAAQHQWHIGFEADRADHPPSGFTLAAMRQPESGDWFVRRPEGDAHLVHDASLDATGYSLAIADRIVPDDLALSVRLRAVGPSRGAGLVWRYRNDRNFYTLLLDLDRGELAVYRIASGNRVRLDVQEGLELDGLAWHTLKVVHVDSTMRVMLGGVRVFEERDRRYDRRTPATGRVGVIATGNSEVWFDDLHIEPRQDRQ